MRMDPEHQGPRIVKGHECSIEHFNHLMIIVVQHNVYKNALISKSLFIKALARKHIKEQKTSNIIQ